MAIVSHKHKFVFIKTHKTAGTSMEIALSKHCGPEDVITPIVEEDEAKRHELGYRGPQNYKIPLTKHSRHDWFCKVLGEGSRHHFYHHASAAFISRFLDREQWDSYFKFCFERNPWDKVVSWYYWRYKTEPRPPFSEFVRSREANVIEGFDLYTIAGEIVVDKVFYFEDIPGALAEIGDRLQLDEPLLLPRTKANFRKDKRDYRDLYTAADREQVAKVYAREIAYHGYTFERREPRALSRVGFGVGE